MKLLSMTMVNFRQFYGKQEIKFAHSDSLKNITVLHGFNGAGKTAFLNAFIWCLYGEITADFEEPDKLASERAIHETNVGEHFDLSVTLRFTEQGDEYIVERLTTIKKEKEGSATPTNETLTVYRISPEGELEKEQRHNQKLIHQFLPKHLYPFFFFNGERLENLSKADAYEEVEDGIKTLLNVKIYDRAVGHLRGIVSTELSKELKKYGSEELQELIKQEEDLKASKADNLSKQKTEKHNLAAIDTIIEAIETEQSGIKEIQNDILDRNNTKKRLIECQAQEQQVYEDLSRNLSNNGYLAFASSIFEKSSHLVTSARQSGELPAKVKPQFVDDLLNSQRCICGRDLLSGSSEVQLLEEWKANTGLAALEESINQTHNAIAPLKKRREDYYNQLDILQTRLSELLTEKRKLKEDLAHLTEKIGDPVYGEKAKELEDQRKLNVDKKIAIKVRQKHLEDKLSVIEEQLVSLRKKMSEQKVQNQKATIVQHQKESTENVADAFEKIYQVLKEDVRQDLAEQISEVWREAAVKDYIATVNDKYQLELLKNVGGVTQRVNGASTGEKVVLSLSFVGSLVRKAGKNQELAKKGKGAGVIIGGEFPLVMDSPFGSLEDDYKASVAEWVPQLAHQVVVMVSKSQWKDVEEAMKKRIGKEYILELHTSKDNADKQIEIDGDDYPYVVSTQDPCEQTLIREVP
jgi:DNA sulfur modification protein DndD